MQRGYRERLPETERVEIGQLRFRTRGIHLVHDQERRAAALADPFGDVDVERRDPFLEIQHEQREVRFLDRVIGLLHDLAQDGLGARGIDPARVHEQEAAAAPGGLGVVAIAGQPRKLVHDGLTLAQDAVEERGFSDVRSPDDRDDGKHRGQAAWGESKPIWTGAPSDVSRSLRVRSSRNTSSSLRQFGGRSTRSKGPAPRSARSMS